MNRQQEEELAWVTARARRALGEAEHLEPRAILNGYRRALRVWHHPIASGTGELPWISHTVFVQGKTGRMATRRVLWERSTDVAIIADPSLRATSPARLEPTLRIADALVTPHEIELLVEYASRIRLPLVGYPRAIAPEDDARGVSFAVGRSTTTLEWSGSEPEAWKPLMEWVERLQRLLQHALDG